MLPFISDLRGVFFNNLNRKLSMLIFFSGHPLWASSRCRKCSYTDTPDPVGLGGFCCCCSQGFFFFPLFSTMYIKWMDYTLALFYTKANKVKLEDNFPLISIINLYIHLFFNCLKCMSHYVS